MRDYVGVTYGDLPYTSYPRKLARYLMGRYEIREGARLLDVGCGRGEYVEAFSALGVRAEGCDPCDYAKTVYPKMTLHKDFPFLSDWWDVIFSKSLLEHLSHPWEMMNKMFYFLKPGGLCIAMVPDYEECMKGFYADCTHVHPFMQSSLAELFTWAGFDDVKCEKFLQSPPLWDAPWKTPFYKMASYLPRARNDYKFSQRKYTMLLCTGKKPEGESERERCRQ